MKKRYLIFGMQILMISCLLAAMSLPLFAQKKTAPPNEMKPAEGTFKVLTVKPVSSQVVKGAPYSATATTETVQTLSDGNQIIRKNESKLYRDSEGRTRSEQTLATIGKWATNGKAQQIITVSDPVAGISYNLNPQTRIAHKFINLPQNPVITKSKSGPKSDDKPIPKAEERAPIEKKRAQQQEKPVTTSIDEKHAKPVKKESLGKQMIEGIEAEGVRVTNTIPAGEIGNVKPIEIVEETWYSRDLQIVLLRKQRDPRSGETTYRLTNLHRSEPHHTLFELPVDYTVNINKVPMKPKAPKE